MDVLLFGLLLAFAGFLLAFVLPVASWLSIRSMRHRLDDLEQRLQRRSDDVERLEGQVRTILRERAAPPATPPAAIPTPEPRVPTRAPRVPTREPRVPSPESRLPAPESRHPTPEPPVPAPGPPVPTHEPPVPIPQPGLRARIDWEGLVGVKLFSAIAGIALVLAAVLFLRYSIEAGWLQPPVRVLIGVFVSVALLVVCELKAARRYAVTANALDAAAVAILFATFFAAHALWALISAWQAFALLALVAALAVALSVRRESLFIAVLGLLGGFATPALLSSGDNRPISLFGYLLLLNLALAGVAHRRRWPVLTALTLVFTTVYQWIWVFTFLDRNQLTLAMGIFLIFPVSSFLLLTLARPRALGGDAEEGNSLFGRTAALGAAVPLLFAAYLAGVPAFAASAWILFAFLLIVDAGLLAVAIARREWLLHYAGAVTTPVVLALWLSHYETGGATAALVFTAVFSTVYLLAPWLAARLGRDAGEAGTQTAHVAPLLLFVPAVLVRIEPGFGAPFWPFAVVLALVGLVAARAIAVRQGRLYFVAAFFAVAAQAAWSATHLTTGRLRSAVAIYVVFGLASLAVPVAARRLRRPLEPGWGSGVVLLASLGLLLFLSLGDVAPAALWALALLLAILNAVLFVESAAGGLPPISLAGSVISWVVLGTWWFRAGAGVGVVPSLTVLCGLTLVTLGGYVWAHRTARPVADAAGSVRTFRDGLFLGLAGHLFLVAVVTNPGWGLPPWPWMGALAVLVLAASAASVATATPRLHAASVVAAALVVAAWCAASHEWTLAALVASAMVSAYALGWIAVETRGGRPEDASFAALLTVFAGEATAIVAVMSGPPPIAAVVAAHVVNLSVLLALAWRWRWPQVALWAAGVAAYAAGVQAAEANLPDGWRDLLLAALAPYAVFVAYPLVLGARAKGERNPYVAAVIASATFFFVARQALASGGYGWMIGVLPVGEGAVMALLLRQLLAIQPPGERDLGRLALTAGAALAFVTVAIPLQLRQQWITIGWALEAAALAWLYRRIPHRGLLLSAATLFAVVFARLALNPSVLEYAPRGLRIVNWYLYTYVLSAAALLAGGRWLAATDDRLVRIGVRASSLLPAGAVVLLFLLLNIEIADFYAAGPGDMFRLGVTLSQDLTYTIGWLAFGILLLAACIYLRSHPGRIAALALIAVTTFKCFLYDLRSLEGLYRIASFAGLAVALALVSVALQKFVLSKPEAAP